jgi:hypothetical protein
MHLVVRHHLPVADDRLLRFGPVVLDDDLDLPAEEAALLVERLCGEQQAVAPGAVVDRGVTGQPD